MKKINLIVAILLFSIKSFSQSPFHGLIGNSYQLASSSGVKSVNKPLYIIYNKTYCYINIGGVSSSFTIERYSTSLIKGELQESFFNEEDNIMQRGWFDITILHKKNGKSELSIQKPLYPGGAAYIVENASDYSESGLVKSHPFVKNWKDLAKKAAVVDSLNKLKILDNQSMAVKKRAIDSIWKIRNTEALLRKSDSVLMIGNNFNNIDTKTISKNISNSLSKKLPDKYIYGNVKLLIDINGNVTSSAKERATANTDVFLPYINDVLSEMKLRVSPFVKDGKRYPSYANAYISNIPNR